MCDKQNLRSACAYAQSDQSLCLSLEYSLSVKLLTEHHLEFLSLKGGCAGSYKSTLVIMPHCWNSHVTAHIVVDSLFFVAPIVFLLFCSLFCCAVFYVLSGFAIITGEERGFCAYAISTNISCDG